MINERLWLRYLPNIAGVYRWLNLVNQKIYIGSAMDMRRRNYYPRSYGNKLLRRAVMKYGIDNFELTVQEIVLRGGMDEKTWSEFLVEREQYWIDYYRYLEGRVLYNLSPVAGRPVHNQPHTEESKKKMSLLRKGRKLSDEHKRNIGSGHKGRLLAEDHKKKIGRGNKGKVRSADAKEKIRDALTGYRHTDEAKKNMSEARKRVVLTDEARRKMGAPNIGRVFTEDHKRRISEAKTGCKLRPLPEETKQKISEALKGRKLTEEHKNKIRRAWKSRNSKLPTHEGD